MAITKTAIALWPSGVNPAGVGIEEIAKSSINERSITQVLSDFILPFAMIDFLNPVGI